MKRTFLYAITTVSIMLWSCSSTKQKETGMEISNKQKVVELLKSIETGNPQPAEYISKEKYIQHNLHVADGIEGFGALLKQLPANSVKVNTVRAFEDGNMVFTQTDYDFFGPKIGFDVFRFENGKIVEHWDNLQDTPENPNPSGHTMIDGSLNVIDEHKTDANKKLVKNFVTDILVNGDLSKLSGYFNGDNYTQHNPQIGDGLSGLGEALKYLESQGIAIKYNTIHQVLGQGNFVLVMSEGLYGDTKTSYYDLFRVENGFIAEHWDVIEPILPKSEWKNTNGKF